MSAIYYNGTILTMDDSRPQAEALFVKEGKIQKRGTKEEVFACKEDDTVCIDLDKKTMLPGFIDGHSHFSGLANSLMQCDLSKACGFKEIVKLLKAFIRENQIPKGQWVIGTNYDHNFLEEKNHPDKGILDEISKEYPLVIIHASSHMGVTNSLGLKMQGLEASVQDPPGGHYGRLAGSRELNGYMEEKAFVQFRNAIPTPDIQCMMHLFQKAQEIYASYGITTVQEGMVTESLLALLHLGAQRQIFYLDVAGYLDLETCGEPGEEYRKYSGHYFNHLKIGGYKIFLDGSPQGKTAWMKAPYQGSEDGYCGYPVKTDDQVYGLILKALKKRQQLLAHCNGDAAAEQYITQFEQVLQNHPEYSANRPVMIHAQLVEKKQLERMKRISMMPSFFVAHIYHWGEIHIQNFGIERAKDISPAGTALRLHLPFTFHQDSPVLPPDVFETVWCAAKRETKAGKILSKEERISVYDALKAMTVNGAYQYGEEKEKGSIQEGKDADLIIIDKNPLKIPIDEVKNIKVLETIKAGNVVYRRQ